MNIPFKPVIITGILLAATYLIVSACIKGKNRCMHTTLGRTKCFCEKLYPSSFLPHQNIINSYACKDITNSKANLQMTNDTETESNNNIILNKDLFNFVHPEDTLSKEEITSKLPNNNNTILFDGYNQDLQEKFNDETSINNEPNTPNSDNFKQKNESKVISQKTINVDLCHKKDDISGSIITGEDNIVDPNDKLPEPNQNPINNTDQKTDQIDKSLEISNKVVDDKSNNILPSTSLNAIVGEKSTISIDDKSKKEAENNDANNNLSNIFIITALCDDQKEEAVLSDNEEWHDASEFFSSEIDSND